MHCNRPYAPGACRGLLFIRRERTAKLKSSVTVFAAVLFLFGTVFGLASCRNDNGRTEAPIRFAVIADPHMYDVRLGTTGPDFYARAGQEVKMFAQSEAIFKEAIRLITEMDPQPEFLLIPGDLTKDGAEESHRKMAAYLEEIKSLGIAVFVIPGNHDIANPDAATYGSYGSAQVYSPGPEAFAEIYAPFGYARAISRDSYSLSYVAEPTPDVWLFAIDACRYEENTDTHVVGGRLKSETGKWLLDNLDAAKKEKKNVIAMMHHGIVEHLVGQGAFLPEFLIEEWDTIGHELASTGMNVIFTGHYHTQNITRRQWEDGTAMVEIQTGSLLNYPVPMRIVDFDVRQREMDVTSLFVADLPRGAYPDRFCCFEAFAHDFTHDGVSSQVLREMTARYGFSPKQMELFAPMLTKATMAHFAGNERPAWRDFSDALKMAESAEDDISEVGLILLSLYNDLPPSDNETVIELNPKPVSDGK